MWYDKTIKFASGARLAIVNSEGSKTEETKKGRLGWPATAQNMRRSARKGSLPWKIWNQEDPSAQFCLFRSAHNSLCATASN